MIHRTRSEHAAVHDSGWAALPEIGVEVTRLPLVDTQHTTPAGAPLFARLTYADALVVANRHGARLVRPATVEHIVAVGLVLRPFFGTPTAETTIEHSRRHDSDVWAQLSVRGWDQDQPVANAGKHWVDGAPEGRSRLFGWWDGRRWVQPLAVAHNRSHHDDGTTTLLERELDRNERITRETPPPPLPESVPPPTVPGDRGEAVGRWQAHLNAVGCGPVLVDGAHGPQTEAATVRWLALHGFERASDSVIERDPDVPYPIADEPTPITSRPPDTQPDAVDKTETDPMSPIVVPAVDELVDLTISARFFGAARALSTIELIVLHSTENPIRNRVARNVAMWFNGPSSPRASAHFVVGPDETIRGVPLDRVAWAAPKANRNGVQVEQVGQASKTDWLRSGSDDRAGRMVLERSALLVAALCRELELPAVRVDAAGLRRGERGITTHAAVTEAFGASTHVDPGMPGDRRWPWAEYLALVERAL